MTTLLVGFDSAWTVHNAGGVAALFERGDRCYVDLGPPRTANFQQAADAIRHWQHECNADRTVVLIDQPTIVTNSTGQRPVENIVSSAITKRRGAMQPANTGRVGMFCRNAPIWPFLEACGGPADFHRPSGAAQVFETYPALAMAALGWTLPDPERLTGRLPKYNPDRKATFSLADWQYVCRRTAEEFRDRSVPSISEWVDEAAKATTPKKPDQDRIDACVCLLVALHLSEGKRCLIVGEMGTGYIVVPHCASLVLELQERCVRTMRSPSEFVMDAYVVTK
jgi:predicted RNase H-like nuclease